MSNPANPVPMSSVTTFKAPSSSSPPVEKRKRRRRRYTQKDLPNLQILKRLVDVLKKGPRKVLDLSDEVDIEPKVVTRYLNLIAEIQELPFVLMRGYDATWKLEPWEIV